MNIAWEGGASTSYFERLTRTWGKSKLYLPIIGILDILSIANPLQWISYKLHWETDENFGGGKIIELGEILQTFASAAGQTLEVSGASFIFNFDF